MVQGRDQCRFYKHRNKTSGEIKGGTFYTSIANVNLHGFGRKWSLSQILLSGNHKSQVNPQLVPPDGN